MRVMAVCLHHVKIIICDQFFFTDFISIRGKEGNTGKTYPVIDVPAHGEHNGASYNSV